VGNSVVRRGRLLGVHGWRHRSDTLGGANEVNSGGRAAFDGNLETPNRIVIVSTVERETILSTKVSNTVTRVRIWVNRPNEPDIVIIGVG
jgi:hypothetical protein